MKTPEGHGGQPQRLGFVLAVVAAWNKYDHLFKWFSVTGTCGPNKPWVPIQDRLQRSTTSPSKAQRENPGQIVNSSR